MKNLRFQYDLFKFSFPVIRHGLRCGMMELMRPGYLKKVEKRDIAPVFIVGSGRSGNTLLARLLHETGGVHFGPENFTLASSYSVYLQCINAPWPERVDRILKLFSSQEESWRWKRVDVASVRAFLLSSNEHTLGNIIHAWYLFYGKRIEYPALRWGCKTPNLTPFITKFLKIFPGAKIIHIVRDPKDVMASYAKTDIEPYNASPGLAELLWYYRNRALLQLSGRSEVILYELLADDPHGVIAGLCRRLLIEPERSNVTFDCPDLTKPYLGNVNKEVQVSRYSGDMPVHACTRELYTTLCDRASHL